MLQVFGSLSKTCNMLPQRNVTRYRFLAQQSAIIIIKIGFCNITVSLVSFGGVVNKTIILALLAVII